MSYESWLVAQMRALRKGKPLERNTYTILADSLTPKSSLVSLGGFRDDDVNLVSSFADFAGVFARCRRALRVY
jgi:hypothetical protein